MPYNVSARQQIGFHAEDIACEHLIAQGLKVLVRNFRCKCGEIDLIMQDQDILVFVEVRSRSQVDDYDPIASIGYGKQQRLIRAALFFLEKKPLLASYPCRFDVIGITYPKGNLHIEWIPQAFSL